MLELLVLVGEQVRMVFQALQLLLQVEVSLHEGIVAELQALGVLGEGCDHLVHLPQLVLQVFGLVRLVLASRGLLLSLLHEAFLVIEELIVDLFFVG